MCACVCVCVQHAQRACTQHPPQGDTDLRARPHLLERLVAAVSSKGMHGCEPPVVQLQQLAAAGLHEGSVVTACMCVCGGGGDRWAASVWRAHRTKWDKSRTALCCVCIRLLKEQTHPTTVVPPPLNVAHLTITTAMSGEALISSSIQAIMAEGVWVWVCVVLWGEVGWGTTAAGAAGAAGAAAAAGGAAGRQAKTRGVSDHQHPMLLLARQGYCRGCCSLVTGRGWSALSVLGQQDATFHARPPKNPP